MASENEGWSTNPLNSSYNVQEFFVFEKQNSQVVTLSGCLDSLAHNSCIFLGDLNSSWHGSSSIFWQPEIKAKTAYPAGLEQRVNFYQPGMFLQESGHGPATDSKEKNNVILIFLDWINSCMNVLLCAGPPAHPVNVSSLQLDRTLHLVWSLSFTAGAVF